MMKSSYFTETKERHCSFHGSNEGTKLYEASKVIICFLFCAQ